jgi:hypothetical protein
LSSATAAPNSANSVKLTEYQATDKVNRETGHGVYRLPTTESEQIGSLPHGSTIRVIQVADGWGKLDISMESMVKESSSYQPHDLKTEGWTMIQSDDAQEFFKLISSSSMQSSIPSSSSSIPLFSFSLPPSLPKPAPALPMAPWSQLPFPLPVPFFGSNPTTATATQTTPASPSSPFVFGTNPLPPPAPTAATSGSSASTTTDSDGSGLIAYTEYRATENVGATHRVRRLATTESEHVASLSRGCIIRLTEVVDGWGKLHPSMENVLQRNSATYKPHDLKTEGWTMISGNGQDYFRKLTDSSSSSSSASTTFSFSSSSFSSSSLFGGAPAGPFGSSTAPASTNTANTTTTTTTPLLFPFTIPSINVPAPVPVPATSAERVDFIVFHPTDIVKPLGMRVHRTHSIDSPQVGSIKKEEDVAISQIKELPNHKKWGKVHPSMSMVLDVSFKYAPHDLLTEGWIRISDGDNVFLAPVDQTANVNAIMVRDGPAPVTATNATAATSMTSPFIFPIPNTTVTSTNSTSVTTANASSTNNNVTFNFTSAPALTEPVVVKDLTNAPHTSYRSTSKAPSGGSRIRREANPNAEHVGTLKRELIIRIVECTPEGWGKLHPSMYPVILNSFNFRNHDLHREGWVRLHDGNEKYYTAVTNCSTAEMSELGYLEYEPSWRAEAFGCRIRRTTSLQSEQVATIPKGSRVRISHIVDGWGKVHPSMMYQLSQSANYRPFDAVIEGWTLLEFEGIQNYQIASPESLAVEENSTLSMGKIKLGPPLPLTLETAIQVLKESLQKASSLQDVENMQNQVRKMVFDRKVSATNFSLSRKAG